MANPHSYTERLNDAAEMLGIKITEGQSSTLLQYISQLERWNRTYNLTALRDPEQMLIQHLFDSLAVVGSLDNILYKNTVNEARIVDVGSGAGLPGVVLAVLRPHWQVHCVDAVDKKMAFVRQMAGVLALPNLHALHARIESMPSFQADIVISRAFASLLDFATLGGPHARQGGHLAAMKGRVPQDEIDTLAQQTDWRASHVQALHVPELNAQRCLVWMSRQGTL